MSAHALLDVQPLGRLLFRRRVAVGAAGIGMWVLGLGWMGLAARFNSVRDRADDADFAPLLVAAGIVMLPAFFGALVSESLHEVLRRPTMHVLPGLRRRLRSSTRLFALVVAVALAAGLSALLPGLAPHEAVGPALLGSAAGAWAMVRVGGAGFWFVRLAAIAALAYFAGPLCAVAAASPLAGLAFALTGLVLLDLRLRPDVLRASLFSETPTFLSVLFMSGRRSVPAGADEPELLPPPRLGGSVSGWVAARTFEQRTTKSQIGTFAGILRFAFFCSAIALVGPLLSGWMEGETGLERLVATFVGSAGGATASDHSGPTTLIFILGMFAGMVAWIGSVPLVGSFLFPMSRSMHAALAFRVALMVLVNVFCATVIAGATVSAILIALTGSSWTGTLPVFAWVALANLLVMPWIQVGVHTLSRVIGRLPLPVALGAVPLTLCALYFTLAEVRGEWGTAFGAVPAWMLALGYLAVLGASLAFLRVFLTWHFRTCDLVRD